MLLASTLLASASARAAGEDDEAWIARYLASGKAPGLVRAHARAQDVEFSQLSGHLGRRARFVLADGRERRGIVESVSGGQVQVRAQFGSGFFLYSLSRNDIRGIQLD